MLEDFVHRFKTAVDALMSHPGVRVTHVWIGAPASDEALSRWANARGCPLPAELACLYRQADGLQLRWVDTGDETYDPERDDKTSFACVPWGLYDQRGHAAGLLDVPSIEILAERDTIGSQFEGGDACLDRAVVFDSYSESSEAVLYFGDGADDPWISIGSDHLADVPPPGESTLSRYLNNVLATWATVWQRGNGAARRLDELLRRRTALDPARSIGQRVFYVDEGRGYSNMHGRALSLIDARETPSWWPFARTLVEVVDDFGETIYVPLRAVFRPDDGDAYERLWSDRATLRGLLEGRALPMFEQLAPVAEYRDRTGISGGPALANAAWPYAALCAMEPAEDAVRRIVAAVDTLLRDPEVNVARPIAWPPNLPRRPQRATGDMTTLASALLDAVVVLVVGRNPPDVSAWLGADATRRLQGVLARLAAGNRLRGYDPLTDATTAIGFLSSALAGTAPSVSLAPLAHLKGTEFGLADLRVVHAVSHEPPT